MPSGLQTFDAQGNVIIDTSVRCGVLLGTVDSGKFNGSVVNGGFANGTPFWSVICLDVGYAIYGPKIVVTGNTLTWTFRVNGANYNNNFRIIYGTF